MKFIVTQDSRVKNINICPKFVYILWIIWIIHSSIFHSIANYILQHQQNSLNRVSKLSGTVLIFSRVFASRLQETMCTSYCLSFHRPQPTLTEFDTFRIELKILNSRYWCKCVGFYPQRLSRFIFVYVRRRNAKFLD